jgi:hypothetical protein
MHCRHLALGILASLVWAPFAHAGDAVVPDEFEQQQQAVGACDAYGTGYAKLPGTNTCVRVSGHVRFEKRYSNRSSSVGGQTVLDVETRSD